MKKKILMVVLAVLVVAMAFTACSAPADTSSDEPAATEDAATEDAAADDAAAEDTADAADAKADGDIVIGVTYQDLQNEYIKQLADVIEEYSAEKGISIVTADGEGDASNQISQVENFITQGVDAIILNPYDKDGCIPAAQKAAEAGIPCVGLCTQLSDLSILTSYVGSNDVQAGEIEMQQVADALDGKGNIVIIEGPMGISSQIQRYEGIENILKNYPDIKVLYTQTANWDRAEAMALMENWLQTGEQIDGVVAENDEMAMGAFNACKAAGLDIPVVGIDGIPDALNSVKEGGMICSVLQNSTKQAQTAFDVALAAAKGEAVEDYYDVPFEPVTSENIDEYLN